MVLELKRFIFSDLERSKRKTAGKLIAYDMGLNDQPLSHVSSACGISDDEASHC